MKKVLDSTTRMPQMQAMRPLVLGGSKKGEDDTATKEFLSQGNPMAGSHQTKNKMTSSLRVEVL